MSICLCHVSVQLSLVREAGLGPVSPGYSIQPQPNKAKVPISCKLSPAVAGAGRHGAESRVGWRLNVQCREKGWGGGRVAAAAVGLQKGNTGDGRDQAGVLDKGSGDVWPRPEEVSYATPSCEKVTPG